MMMMKTGHRATVYSILRQVSQGEPMGYGFSGFRKTQVLKKAQPI